MRHLNKTPKPQILVENDVAWTAELIVSITSGVKLSDARKARYRHHEIKTALITETSDKCAYCESKISHVTYGDVEHVTAKSVDPKMTYNWENLTLACDVCNTNKGDAPSTDMEFVDPCKNDPYDRFTIVGSLIFGNIGDTPAFLTEKLLKLNRSELVERRSQKIRYLIDQLRTHDLTLNPKIKSILSSDFIKNETGQESEYSAIGRSIAIQFGLIKIDQKQ